MSELGDQMRAYAHETAKPQLVAAVEHMTPEQKQGAAMFFAWWLAHVSHGGHKALFQVAKEVVTTKIAE